MAKDEIISAIDIGSSKIATIVGSYLPEEEKIRVVGVATVVSKGVKKGQIVDIEAAVAGITESVEKAERMAGVTIGTAFVSIGGLHIDCQNSRGMVAVSVPEKEIVGEDVERVMEAARAISLPSNREVIHAVPRFFTVDGQEGIKDPIGMTGVRLEVDTHVISGSATAMRNLAKCISEVGIDIEALVFSGLSSSEAVLTDTEKELGVILVDIGGGTTDVCIYVESALSYSKVIPVGAKNVTNDIAIGLRVSLESAEKIKLYLSEEKKNVVVPDKKEKAASSRDEIDLTKLGVREKLTKVSRRTLVEGIIKPRLSEIFNLVLEEVKKSGYGGMTPAGVVITGGGGLTLGIEETCRARMALPVRVGKPEGITGLIDEIRGPEYATTVGLLLYGVKAFEAGEGGFSLERIGSRISRIPLKGAAKRVFDLLKSFLP